MSTEPAPSKATRPAVIALLVVTQLLALATLPIWGVLSFFCGFYYVGFYYLWPYPIIGIVLAVFAWRAFRRKEYRRASVLTTLPLVVAVVSYVIATQGIIPGVQIICL